MKAWFFPLFFWIWLLNGQLFAVIMSISGTSVQSGMLQRFITPIAIVAYFIMARDLYKLKVPAIKKIYLLAIIFAFLYLFSSLFHETIPYEYSTRFLRFGSICMAGVCVGAHLAYYPCYDKIEKLLPVFNILVIVALGTFGLDAALNNAVIKSEDGDSAGLNYQSFSYYMAKSFSYILYFLNFSTIRGSRYHNLMKIPMLIMCIATSVLCIVGGGRGPFLFFVVISAVFVYFYIKERKFSINQFGIALLLLIAFSYVASQLHIFDSLGFTRVTGQMTEDPTRPLLYAKAWNAFLDSPLVGHGFGSVWWTVGWACHNMFLDLLAEGGLIGFGIVIYLLILSFIYLWKRIKNNNYLFLVLAVFIQAVVENAVSGYWISCETIWFSIAFVIVSIGIKNNRAVKNNYKRKYKHSIRF